MTFPIRKTLIYLAIAIVGFIAGVLLTPYLHETTYQIKDWVGDSIFPTQVNKKIVTLYFATPGGDQLTPVTREIFIEEENNVNQQIKKVINQLIEGPQKNSLFPTVPSQTRIRAVYTKDETIYIDFSSSLIEEHPGGTSGELVTIYSVVNTLLDSFPSYSRVRILVEGESSSTLAGHIDIRESLTKNEEIVATSVEEEK